MVILTILYALGLGVTSTCAFLFLGMFKPESQILLWLTIAITIGLVWPISVPVYLVWVHIPRK